MGGNNTAEVLPLPAERIDAIVNRFDATVEAAERIVRLRAKKWLTVREAFELGYFASMDQSRQLRHKRKGPPCYHRPGIGYVYKTVELEAWLEKGIVRTTESEGL